MASSYIRINFTFLAMAFEALYDYLVNLCNFILCFSLSYLPSVVNMVFCTSSQPNLFLPQGLCTGFLLPFPS